MENLYRHESGISVELIAVANRTATDGREILVVYKVCKSNEIFTENADIFFKEYTLIKNEDDEQLKELLQTFIA